MGLIASTVASMNFSNRDPAANIRLRRRWWNVCGEIGRSPLVPIIPNRYSITNSFPVVDNIYLQTLRYLHADYITSRTIMLTNRCKNSILNPVKVPILPAILSLIWISISSLNSSWISSFFFFLQFIDLLTCLLSCFMLSQGPRGLTIWRTNSGNIILFHNSEFLF